MTNNSLGLNDEEFAVPKPEGRFRIMALGPRRRARYKDLSLAQVDPRLPNRVAARAEADHLQPLVCP